LEHLTPSTVTTTAHSISAAGRRRACSSPLTARMSASSINRCRCAGRSERNVPARGPRSIRRMHDCKHRKPLLYPVSFGAA